MHAPLTPALPTGVARRNSPLLRFFGRSGLRLCGWRVTGEVPDVPRFVAIVAPHTSNWDFVIGVFVMFALDLRILWLGKDSLFAMPLLGPLLRSLGGRPVNRAVPEGTVGDVASTLLSEPRFVVALAPEGTRKPMPRWRSGFYRIAQATGAPILPVWMDWSRHEVGIGEPVTPTGDFKRDVLALQSLYHAGMGRFPKNYVARG